MKTKNPNRKTAIVARWLNLLCLGLVALGPSCGMKAPAGLASEPQGELRPRDAGLEVSPIAPSADAAPELRGAEAVTMDALRARTKSLVHLEDALANEFIVMLLEGETVAIDGLGVFHLKEFQNAPRTDPETGKKTPRPPVRTFRSKLDQTLALNNVEGRDYFNQKLVERVRKARSQPTLAVAQALNASLRRALMEGVWSDVGVFRFHDTHGVALRSSSRLRAKLNLRSVLEIPTKRVSQALDPYWALDWQKILRRQREQPDNSLRLSSQELQRIEKEIGRPLPSKLALLLQEVGSAYAGIELLQDASMFGVLRNKHKHWMSVYKLEDGIPFARDSSDYYWCFSLADDSDNPLVFYAGPNSGSHPHVLRFNDWLAFVLVMADLYELKTEFSGSIFHGPHAYLNPSDAQRAFSILKQHGHGWRIWTSDANIFFPF